MPRFHSFLVAAALSIGVIGAPLASHAQSQPKQQQQTTQTQMYVKSGVTLNARQGPGTKFNKAATFQPGTALTVVQHQGDWAQVKSGNGSLLWVFMDYLTQSAPQKQAVKQVQPQPQKQVPVRR